MNTMKKQRLTGIISAVFVLSFSAYILLDSFVIQQAYETGISTVDTEAFQEALTRMMSLDTDGTDTEVKEEITATEVLPSEYVEDTTEDTADRTAAEDSTDGTGSGRKTAGDSDSHSSHKKSKNNPSYSSSRENNDGSASKSSGSSSGSRKGDDPSAENTEEEAELTEVLSEDFDGYDSYSDENISITVTEYSLNDTQIYVADVSVTSAEYLKTAFAKASYGKNITDETSQIAADNEAILAINGDYYGVQESGYVIRNGVIYRATSETAEDIACFYADGSMQIRNTAEVSAQELLDEGVWQVLSFGPALVQDGLVCVSEDDEVDKAKGSNPRTAIGMIDNNHYIFVVADGRTDESEGLSLIELAEFMESLGVSCAYNLDGGGSSTMYFMGQVVNNPTSGGSIKERSVSDIVYIG